MLRVYKLNFTSLSSCRVSWTAGLPLCNIQNECSFLALQHLRFSFCAFLWGLVLFLDRDVWTRRWRHVHTSFPRRYCAVPARELYILPLMPNLPTSYSRLVSGTDPPWWRRVRVHRAFLMSDPMRCSGIELVS